ncbi:unnamed protein product [Mytilus edulis]|uniref:Uncharacterized protein n=1 Tax=Mytilus edulis TaxID=6550 RepID=A0A8S3R5M5_MYTED|nr:unnamed protein product [Mytilus edulis]
MGTKLWYFHQKRPQQGYARKMQLFCLDTELKNSNCLLKRMLETIEKEGAKLLKEMNNENNGDESKLTFWAKTTYFEKPMQFENNAYNQWQTQGKDSTNGTRDCSEFQLMVNACEKEFDAVDIFKYTVYKGFGLCCRLIIFQNGHRLSNEHLQTCMSGQRMKCGNAIRCFFKSGTGDQPGIDAAIIEFEGSPMMNSMDFCD